MSYRAWKSWHFCCSYPVADQKSNVRPWSCGSGPSLTCTRDDCYS